MAGKLHLSRLNYHAALAVEQLHTLLPCNGMDRLHGSAVCSAVAAVTTCGSSDRCAQRHRGPHGHEFGRANFPRLMATR